MSAFCTNMMLNEKGCISYTVEGVSRNNETNKLNDDLGLIALESQIIGARGSGSYNGSNLKDGDLEYLYNMIIKNINDLSDKSKKKEYMMYLIKLIFKIRDITEGNGEQDIFYKLFMMLNKTNHFITPDFLSYLTGGYDRNGERVESMPYGSFKDLNNLYKLCINDKTSENEMLKNSILSYIKYTLIKDSKSDYPTLCAKWVPRENKSVDKKCNMATDISKEIFGAYLTKNKLMENYRKLLSPISKKIKILETLMAENRWNEITVKNIPSKAFLKYIKALKFENKDGTLRDDTSIDRLELRDRILSEQNKALTNPESSRINTSTLLPHEMVQKLLGYSVIQQDIDSYNAIWAKYSCDFKKKLGEGNLQPGVVLADVSGSMSGLPINVCIALSILLSDLFEGSFKNKVLTFENESRWHDIIGETLYEKVKCLEKAPWGGNTNFKNALKKILDVGIKAKLKDDDMPKVLYIFSDMQWDQADHDKTGFESIELMYKTYGYKMPHIVFWNLRATNTFNNNSNQKNTTMMSGFSPNLFKQFINGNFIESTPWNNLKELLNSDRYNQLDPIIKSITIN